MSTPAKSNKVTVTIPQKLKKELISLKNQRNVSVSFIYKEALECYLEREESKKWESAAEQASKDKVYLDFIGEISNDAGDIYEY